jgi:nicotinamidase-related amidase
MLKLPGRWYRTIPMDQCRYEFEEIELDPARTAFVAMHCWNIGCEDGPAIDPNFCVGMGTYVALAEGDRIMREVMAPCIEAARKAGVLVVHLESELTAARFPQAQEDRDPADHPPGPPHPGEVVPGWRNQIAARSHGVEYWNNPPYSCMTRSSIVEPLPGEPVAFETLQLDRMLRRRGIENLIYSGFATDMCILRAPGGIEPMCSFSYRLFLMRDATVGVEFPDTFEQKIATNWAVRYFETHMGDTVLSEDFLKACGESSEA